MTSAKIILIQELHNIFISETDMLLVQARIEALLHVHKLQFKHPNDEGGGFIFTDRNDMRTCFFEALYNDKNANDIEFFAVCCEVYIDLQPMSASVPFPSLLPVFAALFNHGLTPAA